MTPNQMTQIARKAFATPEELFDFLGKKAQDSYKIKDFADVDTEFLNEFIKKLGGEGAALEYLARPLHVSVNRGERLAGVEYIPEFKTKEMKSAVEFTDSMDMVFLVDSGLRGKILDSLPSDSHFEEEMHRLAVLNKYTLGEFDEKLFQKVKLSALCGFPREYNEFPTFYCGIGEKFFTTEHNCVSRRKSLSLRSRGYTNLNLLVVSR